MMCSGTIESLKDVEQIVATAGNVAVELQKRLTTKDRTLKADDTYVTHVDTLLDNFLRCTIADAYPDCNVISEESDAEDLKSGVVTFVIDPLDGTDVYSQGMPSWCISVGVLDENWEPIAGIVAAPAWGSTFFADRGRSATHNGAPIVPSSLDSKDKNANLMGSSRMHKDLNSRCFTGKIRNLGSTVLQFCLPLIYDGVIGSIAHRLYIWDYVAAHAINRSLGNELEYLGGKQLDYRVLAKRHQAPDYVISGPPEIFPSLREMLTPWHDTGT